MRAQTKDHARCTAADVSDISQILPEFRRDELKDIPIVPVGGSLKEGAVYLDLRHPLPGPIKATAGVTAAEETLYVPQHEIPAPLWNRIVTAVGLPDPESVAAKARATPKSDNRGAEDLVDEAVAESFPSSDPPAWTTGRDKDAAAPKDKRHPDKR